MGIGPRAGPIWPYTENVLDLRKYSLIPYILPYMHMYILVFEKNLMHYYDVQFSINVFTWALHADV